MVQVKIFAGSPFDSNVENEINKWYQENPNIKIVSIKTTSTDATHHSVAYTYTITYETKTEEM